MQEVLQKKIYVKICNDYIEIKQTNTNRYFTLLLFFTDSTLSFDDTTNVSSNLFTMSYSILDIELFFKIHLPQNQK